MEQEKQVSYKEIIKVVKRTIVESFSFLKFRLILLLLLAIFVPLLSFVTSYISALIINELVDITASGSREFSNLLIKLIIVYFAITLFERVAWSMHSLVDKSVYYRVGKFYTLQFLQKASDLDLYHYENAKQNDLIKKARDSYSWRPQSFVGKLVWVIPDIVKVLVSVGIVLYFSPLFFVIISISALPALYVSLKTSNSVWNIWNSKTETRRLFGDVSSSLSSESSLMELRIFRTKGYLFSMVKDLFNDFFDAEGSQNQRKAFLESLATIFASLGALAFFIYSVNQVIQGRLDIGLLTFYLGATLKYSSSLSGFFANLSKIYEDSQYIVDYYKFIDLENKITSGEKKLAKKARLAPRIEFKNVSFSYPQSRRTVLHNINLIIEPGEKIALVGENGAGKSTLIKLLARFYDTTKGQILIDNVPLEDLDLEDWYSQLGILFQSFVRYGYLPAKKSIAVGDINKIDNLNEVVKSAKKAGANKFIKQLELGYDQVLSKHFENGVDLSGGQWQRIALARAFFRDAPILILDEPTSSIDAKGESEIFDRLYKFAENKTIIMISHRFSTVRKADKIYVLEKGRIVEQGTHSELIRLGGIYKNAFELQAKGYQ